MLEALRTKHCLAVASRHGLKVRLFARLNRASSRGISRAPGVRPKAAYLLFVGDIAGLGRDGTVKGCWPNFCERRRTEGLSVELNNEAMFFAVIIRPKPSRLAKVIDTEEILRWCCDVRGRACSFVTTVPASYVLGCPEECVAARSRHLDCGWPGHVPSAAMLVVPYG